MKNPILLALVLCLTIPVSGQAPIPGELVDQNKITIDYTLKNCEHEVI